MRYLILLAFAGILSVSCDEGGSSPSLYDSYNHQAWRNTTTDSLIIPRYESYHNTLVALESATSIFIASPSTSSLQDLRTFFDSAYHAFQAVEAFEFGPAENEQLRAFSNTFPTDTVQIETNTSSSYDFNSISNLDAQGFPALDYLLYTHPNLDSALNYFTGNQGRLDYLEAVVDRLLSLTTTVRDEWVNTYGPMFKEMSGPQVGGALGLFVNAFNFNIELSKRARLGIPLGRFSAGIPFPEKSEALRSGLSNSLLAANLAARVQDFSGHGQASLAGLLDHLQATHQGQSLSDAIHQRLNQALTSVHAIPQPIPLAVNSHSSFVDQAYDDLQACVVLTKVDMPSRMGVLITYQDNDGD